MNPTRLQPLLVVIAIAWVTAFGIYTVKAAHSVKLWVYNQSIIEQMTSANSAKAREVLVLTDAIKTQSHEIDFLQGLVKVLPEEKGFVRTQRAIADEVEVLRAKVGRRLRGGLHVLVDTRANKLYLKRGLTLLWQADCSVGRGGILKDARTGRRWEFVTPHGEFEVLDKIENPLWTKPDWAFVESGQPVPPPNDPTRKVAGELGAYVLNLGDGYLIHGTKTPALLGRPVSHGCVRLGVDDLKKLFEAISLGTKVYIY
jgi:L,D-transpeptidase YbiS